MSPVQMRYRRGAGSSVTPALCGPFHDGIRRVYAALAVCGLLAGCAGMTPDPAATPAEREQAKTPIHTITVRHILAEWSTFGLDHKRHVPGRGQQNARMLPPSGGLHDYSATIQELLANTVCRACEDKPYHRLVVSASSRHGVPSGLIHAVIQKESGYNPLATSHRQARGLMQVTSGAARFVGVADGSNLYDPQININAGTAYLKYLMQNHATFDEVLAAYNSGPGNVRKYNGVPPFLETQRYVKDVKRFYFVTSKE
ncbi:lytic transglycosylase domain-containing protein [Herbaspirillum sp. GCM10030257]|uniref:lytic transglycosylase domain-containing protein n=1 Tax=Herbaspirillum sp. GCM10030257 TaxID=3273393 RepID=UPI003617AB1F